MSSKTKWLLAGIISFFIVLAIDVITDLKIGDKINHDRGAFLRILGLTPSVICLIFATNEKKWLLIAILVLAMVGINYMNLFDGFYNIFRGFGWFFTGSEDGAGDARTDNFFQAIPLWGNIVIKIGGSLVTIIFYILKR